MKVQPFPDLGRLECQYMQMLMAAASPYPAPHIVQFYGEATAMVEGLTWHYAVLELLEGEEMIEEICGEGRTTVYRSEVSAQPPVVAQLFADSLVALLFVHAAGLFHLDVKLENIFRSPANKSFGRGTLIDFGLSQRRPANDMIRGNQGTPAYNPPELYLKTPYDGRKVDPFALGAVLFATFLLYCTSGCACLSLSVYPSSLRKCEASG